MFAMTQTIKTLSQGILRTLIPYGMLALSSRKGSSVMNIKYNRLLTKK